MARITTLTRVFIALPSVIFASCLAAASVDYSSPHVCAAHNRPSNFDYLVLASIADSPHLPAMASYRSTGGQRNASMPTGGPSLNLVVD
jgi:hypothetical protein